MPCVFVCVCVCVCVGGGGGGGGGEGVVYFLASLRSFAQLKNYLLLIPTSFLCAFCNGGRDLGRGKENSGGEGG